MSKKKFDPRRNVLSDVWSQQELDDYIHPESVWKILIDDDNWEDIEGMKAPGLRVQQLKCWPQLVRVAIEYFIEGYDCGYVVPDCEGIYPFAYMIKDEDGNIRIKGTSDCYTDAATAVAYMAKAMRDSGFDPMK